MAPHNCKGAWEMQSTVCLGRLRDPHGEPLARLTTDFSPEHYTECLWKRHWSALTAITKHHRLSSLNKRNLFSSSSGGRNARIKLLPIRLLGRAHLVTHRWLPSHCVLWRERVSSLVSLLVRMIILWDQGPPLMTFYKLNYSLYAITPCLQKQPHWGLVL